MPSALAPSEKSRPQTIPLPSREEIVPRREKQIVVALSLVHALDGARAFAAIYVVIHHVAASRGLNHGLAIFTKFGQEAVITFFLLSGFVIFANETHRVTELRGYALRRTQRIYPPMIAAILTSTLVLCLDHSLKTQFEAKSLLATLFAVQDIDYLKPGVIASPYLNNEPLWSLSYEIFFYFLFPLVHSLWTRWPAYTNWVICAACPISYIIFACSPNHWCLVLAYFAIWWTGAMAAHAYSQGVYALRGIKVQVLGLTILSATSGLVFALVDLHSGVYRYPALQARHFTVALLLLLFAYSAVGRQFARAAGVLKRPLAYLASISYGLYVLHWPLLVQWHIAYTAAGFIFALALLVILAIGVDRGLGRELKRYTRMWASHP